MFNLEEFTLEKAKEHPINLTEIGSDGLGDELTKLRGIGELLAYAGTDNAVCFQNDDVRWGICSVLQDIADTLEKGLNRISSEILHKIHDQAEEPLSELETEVIGAIRALKTKLYRSALLNQSGSFTGDSDETRAKLIELFALAKKKKGHPTPDWYRHMISPVWEEVFLNTEPITVESDRIDELANLSTHPKPLRIKGVLYIPIKEVDDGQHIPT
jgi:hypothetical protein